MIAGKVGWLHARTRPDLTVRAGSGRVGCALGQAKPASRRSSQHHVALTLLGRSFDVRSFVRACRGREGWLGWWCELGRTEGHHYHHHRRRRGGSRLAVMPGAWRAEQQRRWVGCGAAQRAPTPAIFPALMNVSRPSWAWSTPPSNLVLLATLFCTPSRHRVVPTGSTRYFCDAYGKRAIKITYPSGLRRALFAAPAHV